MTEVVKAKPAIIRGRIALAIVFLIRFVEPAEAGTKALAEKYGTTVGKIDDIRKNRNFAYVTEDVKFTEDQVKEAVNYIAAHEDPDHAVVVTDMLNALPIATAEEAEAFASVKRKAGGQPRTDAEGNVIQSGGGNRQKSGKKKAEPAAETETETETETEEVAEAASDEPAADDLLDI